MTDNRGKHHYKSGENSAKQGQTSQQTGENMTDNRGKHHHESRENRGK
jgi:hypothetical protein